MKLPARILKIDLRFLPTGSNTATINSSGVFMASFEVNHVHILSSFIGSSVIRAAVTAGSLLFFFAHLFFFPIKHTTIIVPWRAWVKSDIKPLIR